MRILVVGDIILDEYRHVSSERQAQEAPIPVWDLKETTYAWGGAANVAANLYSLGDKRNEVVLAGIAEGDVPFLSHRLRNIFSKTMKKERIVSELPRILARLDNFKRFNKTDVRVFEYYLDKILNLQLDGRFDAVVVSDYDKGTVSEDSIRMINEANIKLKIVDSKRKDLKIFKGFDILKVNESEYSRQVSLSNELYGSEPFEKLFTYCVVTKGSEGASLRQYDAGMAQKRSEDKKNLYSLIQPSLMYVVHEETFPVEKMSPWDVTGCGDVHTAAMTVNMLETGDIRNAVKFGNICARIAVSRFGTTCVSKQDIKE